ncbi:MAG: 4Fe-4S dicluster domain-containing protein [Planctomycetota bacterium]|jgi:ferredoxin-type protein NapG/ferredoxin-type protein NapH
MSELARRTFLTKAGRVAVRVGLAGAVLYAVQSCFGRSPVRRPVEEAVTGILRPPGALEEARFLAACVRCDLCAQVCETNCIKIFGPWEGKHAGTPHVVSEDSGCNLCLKCTQICPSGALKPLTERAEVAMGTAEVDKRLCVSHNCTGACGACHTVCPFRNTAIKQGLRNAPTVDPEKCVGCGLCEAACIVHDRKAIRVVTKRKWS